MDSVQKFFNKIIGQGYGVEVVRHACANTKKKKLEEDTQLYLFLGDLHLPPHKWEPKFHTVGDYVSSGISDTLGDPDIFKEAGHDLSEFLRAIIGLSSSMKKLLHFVQVGDMYELWLGEAYLFKPGKEKPEWVNEDAPEKVVEWIGRVEQGNGPVMLESDP